MAEKHKWFMSSFLMGKPERVDRENGVLYGVSVVTPGEAKGHGVSLDEDFTAAVIQQGAEKNTGIKSRFGHPNMSSTALGTFLGRAKNFRAGPDGRAIADLFLSADAKETPNGNLFEYVLNMASNNADMLGLSIVFTPGREYKRDATGKKVYPDDKDFSAASEPLFIELEKLHAVDMVDDPAANEGLFSAWANDTFAGAVTEFIDQHHEAFQWLEKNPEIITAFLQRYNAYRQKLNKKELVIMAEETTIPAAEAVEELSDAETEIVELHEGLNEQADALEAATAEAETARTALNAANEANAEHERKAVLLRACFDAQSQELATMKARLEQLGKTGETTPPSFSEAPHKDQKPLWNFKG